MNKLTSEPLLKVYFVALSLIVNFLLFSGHVYSACPDGGPAPCGSFGDGGSSGPCPDGGPRPCGSYEVTPSGGSNYDDSDYDSNYNSREYSTPKPKPKSSNKNDTKSYSPGDKKSQDTVSGNLNKLITATLSGGAKVRGVIVEDTSNYFVIKNGKRLFRLYKSDIKNFGISSLQEGKEEQIIYRFDLKNGGSITGELLGTTKEKIFINVRGMRYDIYQNEVAKIYKYKK